MLAEASWDWQFFRFDDRFYLNVLCGTVGLYERCVQLDAAELEDWQQRGRPALEAVAVRIRQTAPHAHRPHHREVLEHPATAAALAAWRSARPAP